MNSEIEIIVSGADFPTFYPYGASVHYGIDEPPYAEVELDATSLGLLCNFDQHRRKLVTLQIKTTKGCIFFDGMVDGLSFAQQQGSLQARLVIKNRYHMLREVTPKIPGLNIGSLNPYNRNTPLELEGDRPDELVSKILVSVYSAEEVQARRTSIPRFIVNFCISALNSLQSAAVVLSNDASLRSYGEILQNTEAFQQQRFPIIKQLLASIDTSACDDSPYFAGDTTVYEMILQSFMQNEGDLLSVMVNMLSTFGCILVFGNDRAFVVPDAGFLRQPHVNSIQLTRHSTTTNVMFPAEYTGFSFNDNGYRDLKGVYLIGGPMLMPTERTESYLRVDQGRYIDNTVSLGGMMVMPLPGYLVPVMNYSYLIQNKGNNQKLNSGADKPSNVDTIDKAVLSFRTPTAEYASYLTQQYALLDNFAQMEYLKLKYRDRTGSINAIFDTNWAPGAVGTMYTRNPGTYIDFFVTSVSHNFNVQVPNGGNATTQISFNSGRVGSSAGGAGVDQVDFYRYNYQKARTFAGKFVDNIS